MTKKEWYTWTAKLSVHRSWVADGFNLDDERAKEMLAKDLQFADNSELKAKVIEAPNADAIAKEQGYKNAAEMTR